MVGMRALIPHHKPPVKRVKVLEVLEVLVKVLGCSC